MEPWERTLLDADKARSGSSLHHAAEPSEDRQPSRLPARLPRDPQNNGNVPLVHERVYQADVERALLAVLACMWVEHSEPVWAFLLQLWWHRVWVHAKVDRRRRGHRGGLGSWCGRVCGTCGGRY